MDNWCFSLFLIWNIKQYDPRVWGERKITMELIWSCAVGPPVLYIFSLSWLFFFLLVFGCMFVTLKKMLPTYMCLGSDCRSCELVRGAG